MWFPYMHQISVRKNPSYLNSLFIGLTAPLLNIWVVLFVAILVPLVRGIWAALSVLFWVPIMGVMGLLVSDDITAEEALSRAVERARKRG